MKKAIKIFTIVQTAVFATYLISFEFYINVQLAFLSSFFVMLGSMYAYKGMIDTQVKTQSYVSDRDMLDSIDDPHEVYDEFEVNDTPVDELNIKEIIKEEKKRIKTFNLKDIKKGSRAGFSPYRLVPYIFLIIGFIALKNNSLLDIAVYLPSLLVGIVAGYIFSKVTLKTV